MSPRKIVIQGLRKCGFSSLIRAIALAVVMSLMLCSCSSQAEKHSKQIINALENSNTVLAEKKLTVEPLSEVELQTLIAFLKNGSWKTLEVGNDIDLAYEIFYHVDDETGFGLAISENKTYISAPCFFNGRIYTDAVPEFLNNEDKTNE